MKTLPLFPSPRLLLHRQTTTRTQDIITQTLTSPSSILSTPADAYACTSRKKKKREKKKEERGPWKQPPAEAAFPLEALYIFGSNKVCGAIQNQISENTDRKKEEKMHSTMVNETERDGESHAERRRG
ncbi:unnamed protein product [Sphagnum troendelagicum]